MTGPTQFGGAEVRPLLTPANGYRLRVDHQVHVVVDLLYRNADALVYEYQDPR